MFVLNVGIRPGRVALMSIAACLSVVACGDESANTAVGDVPSVILVNKAGCTPFGNPPRPRNDELALLNPLVCSGGGERLPDWTDPQGTVRQACLYQPDVPEATRLPLVIWLQGSAAPAEFQLDMTNLLSQLETADLNSNPSRPGFRIIELAGRITDHYYPLPNDTGTSGWDVWDRQLLPGRDVRVVNDKVYPMNLDALAIDHYLEQARKAGQVDEDRIYMMGWSNGAAMAMLYALNRPEVAAAAVYSAPNPFDALSDPCGQTPVAQAPADASELQIFNPGVPMYHVINNCDIYSICPSGVALENTLAAGELAESVFQIIDELQAPVTQCFDLCGTDPRGTDYTDPANAIPGALSAFGTSLHLRWPTQWNDDLLAFLRDHPRRD